MRFRTKAERLERRVDLWPAPRGRDPEWHFRRLQLGQEFDRLGERPSLRKQLAKEVAVVGLERLDLARREWPGQLARHRSCEEGHHSCQSGGGSASRRSAGLPRPARAARRTRGRRPCRPAFRPGRRSALASTRAYSGPVIEHAQAPHGPTRSGAAPLIVREATPGSLGSPLCVAVTKAGPRSKRSRSRQLTRGRTVLDRQPKGARRN